MHDFKNMSDKELRSVLGLWWVPCHNCPEWMEVPGHFWCWYHEKHQSECDCPPVEKWLGLGIDPPFPEDGRFDAEGGTLEGGDIGSALMEFMTEKDIAFWGTASDELRGWVTELCGVSVYAALSAMRLSASYQDQGE